MTNVEAIELPVGAIVRHKSGKLYRVGEVITQPTCSGNIGGSYSSEAHCAETGCTPVLRPGDPKLDAQYGVSAVWFTGNPLAVASLLVVGQRDGKSFGPCRHIKAKDCTAV